MKARIIANAEISTIAEGEEVWVHALEGSVLEVDTAPVSDQNENNKTKK